MFTNNAHQTGSLIHAQLVIKGSEFGKKIFHTPLHHHQQSGSLMQGRMDLCFCCLRQILTLLSQYYSRNWDSSGLATFLQSVAKLGEPRVSCSQTRMTPSVLFCCCGPSAQRCSPIYLDGNEWLLELLFLSYQLEAVNTFSCDVRAFSLR